MTSSDFAAIVQKYKGLIGEIINRWRCLPAGITRDDLWQAGMIGLWEAAATYDPSRSKMSTHAYWKIRKWILTCINEERQRSRQETLGNRDCGDDSAPMLDRLVHAESLLRLRRRRKRLDRHQREMLRMRYEGGMSFREIARKLDIARPTVAYRHDKTVERLRARMGVDA